jgi:hypothetical protein
MENEQELFLPSCPQCGAWPMALAEKAVTGWNRQARFICGRCKAISTVPLQRSSLLPARKISDSS